MSEGKQFDQDLQGSPCSLYFDEIFSALRDPLFISLYSGTSLKAG